MWKYYRLLNYLYNVQEFSLYSEEWCFVHMFHGCNYDFCISSRDTPFCSCGRVSCLVACCGCIHCIAWSMQVMCSWFYSIFNFIYLSWFVPNFWHYVINLNFGTRYWICCTSASGKGPLRFLQKVPCRWKNIHIYV